MTLGTGGLRGELPYSGVAVYYQRGPMLPAARFRKER